MNIGSFHIEFDQCIKDINAAAAQNDQGALSKAAKKANSLISQLQVKPEATQIRDVALVKLQSIMKTLEGSKDSHVQDLAKLVKRGHPQAQVPSGFVEQMQQQELMGQHVLSGEDPDKRAQLLQQLREIHESEKPVTKDKGVGGKEITRPNMAIYDAKVVAFERAKNAIAISELLLPIGSIDTTAVKKLHVYTEKGPETGKKMKELEEQEVKKLQTSLLIDKVGVKAPQKQDSSTWLLALALTGVANDTNLRDILPHIPATNTALKNSFDKARGALFEKLNEIVDGDYGSSVESFCHDVAKELGNDKVRMANYKDVLETELEKNIPRAKAILDFYSEWRHSIPSK